MDVVSLLAKICTFLKRELGHKRDEIGRKNIVVDKVIIEKSRGEGSLMEQDTIENLTSFYAEYVFTVYNVFKKNFLPMKT